MFKLLLKNFRAIAKRCEDAQESMAEAERRLHSYMNDFVRDKHFQWQVDRLHLRISKLEDKLASHELAKNEEFIEAVIEKINKKQLIRGGQS